MEILCIGMAGFGKCHESLDVSAGSYDAVRHLCHQHRKHGSPADMLWLLQEHDQW